MFDDDTSTGSVSADDQGRSALRALLSKFGSSAQDGPAVPQNGAPVGQNPMPTATPNASAAMTSNTSPVAPQGTSGAPQPKVDMGLYPLGYGTPQDPKAPAQVNPGQADNAPVTGGTGAQPQAGAAPIIPTVPKFDQDAYNRLMQQSRESALPIDPNQPKYRMGVGGRIGHLLMGLASGGVGGALSTIGNRNDPNYIGPGAHNRQYGKDLATQGQTHTADVESLKDFLSGSKARETDYGNEVRQQAVEERAKAAKELTDEKAKAAADKNKAVSEKQDNIDTLKTEQEELKKQMDANNIKTPEEALTRAANATNPADKAKFQKLANDMTEHRIRVERAKGEVKKDVADNAAGNKNSAGLTAAQVEKSKEQSLKQRDAEIKQALIEKKNSEPQGTKIYDADAPQKIIQASEQYIKAMQKAQSDHDQRVKELTGGQQGSPQQTQQPAGQNTPPANKPVTQPNQPPDKYNFNLKRWAAANPKATDIDKQAMKNEMTKQGYTIIE